MPERITVAAPVTELCAISLTGRRLVSVKYPVSSWIVLASTRPMSTAPMASHRGLPTHQCEPGLSTRAHRLWPGGVVLLEMEGIGAAPCNLRSLSSA